LGSHGHKHPWTRSPGVLHDPFEPNLLRPVLERFGDTMDLGPLIFGASLGHTLLPCPNACTTDPITALFSERGDESFHPQFIFDLIVSRSPGLS
jgi:hypothetical protein